MGHPLKNIAYLAAISAASIGVSIAATPALANSSAPRASAELPAYLQCVPYARQVSGIQIYGDAHTWWSQAAGRFARGNTPRVGAVMAFRPHRNMRLGHVAAVSKIIDSRTVLLRHSNWSPINGRRGQIEDNVRAVDVSPANDWSSVRVWYHPLQALGKTAWPLHGFIYGDKGHAPAQPSVRLASTAPARTQSSASFLSAFADLKPMPSTLITPVRTVRAKPAKAQPARADARRTDPIAALIARYED